MSLFDMHRGIQTPTDPVFLFLAVFGSLTSTI